MTVAASRIARPQAAVPTSYNARQVATCYGYPLSKFTGKGYTCGIIELGGGFGQADLAAYFGGLGVAVPSVTAVSVDGGTNTSDGVNGADGEVLLDIEVAGSVAPGATFRVYFAPNTDAGFLHAIEAATADRCAVISISWGGPENSWSTATLDAMDAAILDARKKGTVVFCAAGDNGSSDGTSGSVVDFPASSPNAIGCGGTRLVLDGSGARSSEVVWDDNPTSSATGGGVSAHFPGRQVPDIAGNADPQTGYQVTVDGQQLVFGGTSAVAPLYAGLVLLLSETLGAPLGTRVDLLNTLLTNLGVCFDVTSGNNGAYRAGPGRDDTTGLGVVDGGRLLTVLTDGIPDPAPIGSTPPTPVTASAADTLLWTSNAKAWVTTGKWFPPNEQLREALITWAKTTGLS